jgi:hypothetical protein
MTQGHKRGSRFSAAFKAKVLERYTAGESVQDIGTALKMSPKTVANWITAMNKGHLDAAGMTIGPDGIARTPGDRKGIKTGPQKNPHRKRGTQKGDKRGNYKKGRLAEPSAAAGPTATVPSGARTDKQRVARLELELAFLKRDRAAFDRALKTLGI